MRILSTVILLLLAGTSASAQSPRNLAEGARIEVDSTWGAGRSEQAVDGRVSDESRWGSAGSAGPHWIELTLPASFELAAAHPYTGKGSSHAVPNCEAEDH